ncbi:MAG: hypothetical protein H6662_18990 [Ardenticatenaceae bacterium]|nr:hypothetical protein [Ardenticatenaceae bacterium]
MHYYLINNSTDVTLVLLDGNGDDAGRMVYDGYGMPLTNTLPLTLTGTLPDLPDAATGLVHLGGGRWYDPALGRPLQPDAAGGPPTLPQALNRYAATPVGQPGVYEATKSNLFATAFGHQMPGTVLGVAIDLAPASRVVETQIWGLIETSYLPVNGISGLVSRFTTSRAGQVLIRLPWGIGNSIAAQYEKRFITTQTELRLDNLSGSFADELLGGGEVAISRYSKTRLLEQWEVPITERGTYGEFNPWWKTGLKAGGAAFIIGAGFQLYDDWGNPYLTGWQKVRRAGISGGVSLAAAFAGAGVGALAGTATGVPIVGTVVGTVVGFGVGLWAELQVTPVIFERTGNIPERHLAPLP